MSDKQAVGDALMDAMVTKFKTTTTAETTKTEWVATFHGDNGTVRIAYRNPAALAKGLAEQTSEGWVCAGVFERTRLTCPE